MGYKPYPYIVRVPGGIRMINPTKAVPHFTLNDSGTALLKLGAGDNYQISDLTGGVIYEVEYASNVTRVMGGHTAADKLILQCNSIDIYPLIELFGNGKINLNPPANQDCQISTSGAGRFRYGTFTATGDAVSNGSIEMKDGGGTLRKLMTKA